jgi:DNA-binding CsgD family transcriptional regulator/tetratricopeptide (TPR) repeat protein
VAEPENGLLERTGELEVLRARVTSAAAGRGAVVFIEGAAGTGKTSLLRAAGSFAAASGLAVRSATAGIIEVDLAWSLVHQLFEDVLNGPEAEREELLTGAAALAAPALGLAADPTGSAVHGLYWLTARLAAERPLLLCVDDAHWGDDPSLRYLAYLSRRVADLPVLLAVSSRSGESLSPPLASIGAPTGAEHLALRDLSLDASAELVRRRLGPGAAEAFCTACYRATGGSPFLLEELLGQVRRDGIEPNARNAGKVRGATPETVKRSVLLRLSELRPEARELATAVALLGGEATLVEASALANLPREEAAAAADSLASVAILSPGSRLAFMHPLVREVVYAEIPRHARGQRHRAAASVLDAIAGAPERVLAQIQASDPAGDPWVVERLRAGAADAMLRGAPETAADLLERGLREPPPRAERAGLLLELGRAEAGAGRPGEATSHLREAAELLPAGPPRALTRLETGRALYVAGRPAEAAEQFELGLAELANAKIADANLESLLQAAWLAVARLEVPLRSRAVELGRTLAGRDFGDSYGERALMASLAGALIFEAEPRARALELARLALAEGELIATETADGFAWAVASGALGWGGDLENCDRANEQALADARQRGSAAAFATASYASSVSHAFQGDVATTIADAEQAIAAQAEGWSQFLPAARAQLAWAHIERGEHDQAASQLSRAEADPGLQSSTMRALVLDQRAWLALAVGAPQRAFEHALEAGRVASEALCPNPAVVPWRSRAALAASRLGDRERAEELAGEELRIARRFGAPRPIGVALMTSGMVRGGDGAALLEEAVEVLARSPARLEHASAQLLLGAALRRQGKLRGAREFLRAALDRAVAQGSARVADRAREELKAAGARPRRPRLSGVESLTPAELRVAGLAADGMSNREIAESLFVSLRTVETHLTHTYQKLNAGSRQELAGRLRGAHAPPE